MLPSLACTHTAADPDPAIIILLDSEHSELGQWILRQNNSYQYFSYKTKRNIKITGFEDGIFKARKGLEKGKIWLMYRQLKKDPDPNPAVVRIQIHNTGQVDELEPVCTVKPMFRIRISIKICLLDPDPDPGGKKPRKCSGSLCEYRTGNIKARILL